MKRRKRVNFVTYQGNLLIYIVKTEFLKLYRRCTCKSGYVYVHSMGGSPGDVSEELMTQEKRKKVWRVNCDVGEAMEGFKNEL